MMYVIPGKRDARRPAFIKDVHCFNPNPVKRSVIVVESGGQ